MIREFHNAAKTPSRSPVDREGLEINMDLLIEEFEELFNACGFKFNEEGDPYLPEPNDVNPTDMFHEMVDMVYILLGWAITYGWDFDEGFERVHRANMTKIDPEKGVTINEAGKIVKPDTFVPPELNNVVGDAIED